VASLNHQDSRRLYNTLTVLAWLLDRVSPQHHWKQRLKTLLAQHAIDLQRMGFPNGWEQRPIWQEGTA
jgi:abortive infection bacteriophage resistance protein